MLLADLKCSNKLKSILNRLKASLDLVYSMPACLYTVKCTGCLVHDSLLNGVKVGQALTVPGYTVV